MTDMYGCTFVERLFSMVWPLFMMVCIGATVGVFAFAVAFVYSIFEPGFTVPVAIGKTVIVVWVASGLITELSIQFDPHAKWIL